MRRGLVWWGAIRSLVLGLPIEGLVLFIAVTSIVAGLVGGWVHERAGNPLEKARALAESDKYEDAEGQYLALLEKTPGDVPLVLELLENHESLLHPDDDPQESPAPATAPAPLVDARIDDALGRIPPDAALLARYWQRVLRGSADAADRAIIVGEADREPPEAWANDILGREAQRAANPGAAAARFAREATAFDGRRRDATLACDLWSGLRDWPRIDAALAQPRFARQLGPGRRFDLASERGQWLQAMRWILPAQWEGATLAIVLLAALSAAVWFSICTNIGSPMPARRRRVLYGTAVVLGILSSYLAIGTFVAEVRWFPSLGSHDFKSELLDCVLFVGPREEVAKGLFTLPILIWVKRHGRRRDALACGGLVGLGFAAVENLGYFESGLSTALVRFLTANIFHIATTGLLAASIDDAMRGRTTKGNGIGWTLGFLAFMHGMYDVFALAAPEQGISALPFVSLLPFFLVTRSFLTALGELPRHDGRLQEKFIVGMVLVAGATFVYASAQVGAKGAVVAMAEGLMGTAIAFVLVVDALGRIAR